MVKVSIFIILVFVLLSLFHLAIAICSFIGYKRLKNPGFVLLTIAFAPNFLIQIADGILLFDYSMQKVADFSIIKSIWDIISYILILIALVFLINKKYYKTI